MKMNRSYDPEDIESLLRHKHFRDLYPEERSFVMLHLSGEEEYESMKKMLQQLITPHSDQEMEDPDPSIKNNVMAVIREAKKKRFTIWLNSLFVMAERPWYRQTGLQLAMAIFIVGFGVIAFWPSGKNNHQELAVLQSKPQMDNKEIQLQSIPREESLSETLLTSKAPQPIAPALKQEEEFNFQETKTLSNMESTASAKATVSENLESPAAPVEHSPDLSKQKEVKMADALVEEKEDVRATAGVQANSSVSRGQVSVSRVEAVVSNQSLKEERKLIELLYTSHP
jgi:cbb3-type cytochrome oxidase subunit 3